MLVRPCRPERQRADAPNPNPMDDTRMSRRELMIAAAMAAAAGVTSTRPAHAAGSDSVIGLSNGYFGFSRRSAASC